MSDYYYPFKLLRSMTLEAIRKTCDPKTISLLEKRIVECIVEPHTESVLEAFDEAMAEKTKIIKELESSNAGLMTAADNAIEKVKASHKSEIETLRSKNELNERMRKSQRCCERSMRSDMDALRKCNTFLTGEIESLKRRLVKYEKDDPDDVQTVKRQRVE